MRWAGVPCCYTNRAGIWAFITRDKSVQGVWRHLSFGTIHFALNHYIRQAILVEKASIEQAIARVTSSQANVQAQSQALATTKQQLDSDLTSWAKDVTAATETAAAFDDRLRAATIELSALENSIVRLGKELTASWTTLTATADAATR